MTGDLSKPHVLRDALRERARIESKRLGITTADYQKQVVMDLAMSHLEKSDAGAWRLLGSAALAARGAPGARAPKDLDVECTDARTIPATFDAFKSAIQRDTGSPINFEVIKQAGRAREGSASVVVAARVGEQHLLEFTVDLRPQSNFDRNQREMAGPMAAGDGLGLPSGSYSVTPIDVQVAGKISGMMIPSFMLKPGTPSTRYKDVVDLLVMARSSTFDIGKVRDALQQYADDNGGVVPASYSPPSQDMRYTEEGRQLWVDGVDRALRRSSFSHLDCRGAEAELESLLGAVLNGRERSMWNGVELGQGDSPARSTIATTTKPTRTRDDSRGF